MGAACPAASVCLGKERKDLIKQPFGCLFGDVMTAGKRTTTDVQRDSAPLVQRREAAVHDALLTPQGQYGHGEFEAAGAIGAVVIEIDGRRRAVVLAYGVSGTR